MNENSKRMFTGEVEDVTISDGMIIGIDILSGGELKTIYTDSLGLSWTAIQPGYKVNGLVVSDVGGPAATCLHVMNGRKSQFYGQR